MLDLFKKKPAAMLMIVDATFMQFSGGKNNFMNKRIYAAGDTLSNCHSKIIKEVKGIGGYNLSYTEFEIKKDFILIP